MIEKCQLDFYLLFVTAKFWRFFKSRGLIPLLNELKKGNIVALKSKNALSLLKLAIAVQIVSFLFKSSLNKSNKHSQFQSPIVDYFNRISCTELDWPSRTSGDTRATTTKIIFFRFENSRVCLLSVIIKQKLNNVSLLKIEW